jgi:cysteine synthase A
MNGSSSDSIEESIHQAMIRSRTGGLCVEGTSGSTGISLATLCAARGHACLVVLPDDQASEKKAILTTLGAVVHVVPNAAISNPNHYFNIARHVAEIARTRFCISAVFMNQFENEANFRVHYSTTGPELYNQCPQMDAFVMSSGTGGTIAGVAKYLKSVVQNKCRVVLVDPPGSALYHRIHHGVAYAPQQRERAMKRHRYDTLAEGIGLDRMTHNFGLGVDCVDDAIRVSDQEAVDMAHWLLRNEGLWVGSSSAMNVTGAVRVASSLPEGSTVVTVICDAGSRHVTRFWNADFIREWGLVWPGDEAEGRIPECLQPYYKCVSTNGT